MLIVLFSDIAWRDVQARPQHIALALAKRWKVIWVEPTTLLKKTHLHPFNVEPNIYIVSIPGIPYTAKYRFLEIIAKPLSRIRILRNLLTAIQTAIVRRSIKLIGMPGDAVGVFINNFHCIDAADNLHPKFIQFDYIDNVFGFTSMPPHVTDVWRKTIQRSTFITVTSMKLAEQIRPVRQTDIHFAGNGVEYSFFANPPGGGGRPADLPIGKPIVCYTGSISSWLDYDLISFVSRTMQDINFVFIGPANPEILPVIEEITANGNFYHLGFKPYKLLPNYLRHVDVGIIPFRRDELTTSVNPLKLYEYCAAGKPTVASRFADELLPLQKQVHFAGSQEEFASAIRVALLQSHDPVYVESLRAFARKHDWQSITSSIVELINRYSR